MKMKTLFTTGLIAGLFVLGACNRMDHLGKPPSFTPANETQEHVAMLWQGLPHQVQSQRPVDNASLWSGSQQSLLGDRRAMNKGDILTVVIEIDEEAEISNDTSRSRSSSESLNMPQLLGLPQRLDEHLPTGASAATAVDLGGASTSRGNGSVKRSEKLELKVAATVVDILPNGVLAISGSQELRVNFELRELLVSGYVRPQDISRKNEITYDKIASARVSYGGRGQITDVQQPRYGQQVLDAILPF
ncbi:flagellar L-ring protein precursor H [Roseobacter sp. SK209-2-6]|uniref:flagellar basal body L-ring protein FlgH n=1 Tax=Roseobacter sp. SK209-2-6 TaxID=388739 RepID=UPI0000F3D0C3|nr:flagellar L-ring protein precursor H [Roseobacter sp. SK209-2-6]